MTLTLDDLRQQMSTPTVGGPGRTGSTIADEDMQPFLDSAVALAADYCGPVVPVQVTELYDGGGPRISLRRWPIVSVDVVVEAMCGQSTGLIVSTAGTAGWLADLDAGTITRVLDGGYQGQWAAGLQNVTVTYTVGTDPVPEPVLLGILILAQHLYGSKVGTAAQRPGGTTAGPSTAYAVPNRVLELWRPFMRPPGVA